MYHSWCHLGHNKWRRRICFGKGCIEIKCPSKYKHSTIHEACLARDSNFCLEPVDGELHLKQGHQYYTQVQTNIWYRQILWFGLCYSTHTTKHWVLEGTPTDGTAVFHCSILARAKPLSQASVSSITLPQRELQQNTVKQTSKRGRKQCPTPPPKKERKRQENSGVCVCHGPEQKGDVVSCDNENSRIQWFHLAIVGLEDAPAADDVWFCVSCSKYMCV